MVSFTIISEVTYRTQFTEYIPFKDRKIFKILKVNRACHFKMNSHFK